MRQSRSSAEKSTGGYFRGRVVLITGASSGIGRDIAMRFSEVGAKVALFARWRPSLDELVHEIESRGGTALVLPDAVIARGTQFIEWIGTRS